MRTPAPVDRAVRRAAVARDLVRRGWSRRLRGLFWLIERAPAGPRRSVFGRLATLAEALRARRATAALADLLGAVALYGAARREEAAAALPAAAGRHGLTTRLRLARIAVDAGDPATAAAILGSIPAAGERPAVLRLRGEVAVLTGHYRDAVPLLRRALELQPRSRTVSTLLARAEAEVEVLSPGWRPAVPVGDRLADPRPGVILHLLTNSLPYRQAGYTVRSQSVARSQRDEGLEPHMATRAGFPRSDGVARAPAVDEVDGIPYHRLDSDFDRELGPAAMATATATAAVPLIERLRPAALQPTTNHLNAQVALALRDRFALPVVYEVRGFLEETWQSRMRDDVTAADRYAAARATETDCMRAADAIVTLSETMRADIVGRGGIDPDLVLVVPNAVDVDRFRPGPRDAALAGELGIADDETVVGYVSSFTGYEGIRYLIEAVGLLRARGRRVRLLLVGDGEERRDLEAAVRAASLDDGTAILTGRVPHDHVLRYYRTIDVFVVPRTAARVSQLVTPLKPYEAMAMERALVVSAVDALREIVVEGETGLTFRPEDAAHLADVIDPLLDDPRLRLRLGRAARAWVAEHRTWRQNGRRYRELYERLGVA